jgi:Transglutaminase-like superfamily
MAIPESAFRSALRGTRVVKASRKLDLRGPPEKEVTCNVSAPHPRILVHQIPEGYRGTLKTAAHIAQLVKQGAKDFQVRQTAIDILMERGIRPKDYRGEIRALFEWAQRNIRYTKDTVRVEVLHSARRMLELGAGDCDDFSILLGAMLEAIGHPVRLVLTGPDPRKPMLFSHVYVEAYCQGRWIPLDATMPYPMGWAPRAWVRKVIEIDRRPTMLADDMELRGTGAAVAAPDWLRGLVRSLRSEAIPPKDPRVKSLWNLLRQRQLLAQNPWLKALLQRCWRGLQARKRPRTTTRLVVQLRQWGVLPPRSVQVVAPGALPTQAYGLRRLRPVVLRRVASARPAGMQPVRAVRMPVVGRGARR